MTAKFSDQSPDPQKKTLRSLPSQEVTHTAHPFQPASRDSIVAATFTWTRTPAAQGIIKGSLESTPVDIEKHSNQDVIARLEEENRFLFSLYIGSMGLLGAGLFIPALLAQVAGWLAGTVSARWTLTRAQKVISLLRVTKALVAAFPEGEMQLFTDLPVPEHGNLDLFLRFPLPPKKAIFGIALRSQGKRTIIYNEKRERLQVRRGDNIHTWKPNHIEQLSAQGFWLRINQPELFGTSRNDRNRPVIKVLCLTGETKLGKHNDHLYTQVGDQRVLLIEQKSSVFVLEEEQLVPFLRSWVSQGVPRKPKTSTSEN